MDCSTARSLSRGANWTKSSLVLHASFRAWTVFVAVDKILAKAFPDPNIQILGLSMPGVAIRVLAHL